MANSNKSKRNKNGTSKSLVDPIRRPKPGIGRMRLNFDGNTLHGTQFLPRAITAGFRAATILMVDASSTNTTGFSAEIGIAGASNGLNAATKIYGDYWYTSMQLTWIPHVAPGVADGGAPIYIGYVDNPEVISGLTTATSASLITTSRSTRNVKTFNAWQPFTYNVPLTKRLPRFNVDTTNTYLTANDVERSVQGAVVVGYEAINAVADLGQFRVTFNMELRNMNVNQST